MSPDWIETYLGLIFQIYGLASFVLGGAALLSKRCDSGTGPAAFGMLHGLQEFVDGERLRKPAAWLAVLETALMVASFVALPEFGRRLWNERLAGQPAPGRAAFVRRGRAGYRGTSAMTARSITSNARRHG